MVARNLFAFEVRRRSCTCRKTKAQKSMRNINLLAVVVLSLSLESAVSYGQSYGKTNPIAGQWTYRSFRNSTDLVNGDAAKALALIFGEGTFTFETPSPGSLRGTLDMGGGYVLDIEGTVRPEPRTENYTVVAAGHGRPGTPTAGWEYDYHAELAYHWPNGVNQVPALLGSVIRATAHDGGAAGLVASFIAVRHL
jgi:hypothetical protein